MPPPPLDVDPTAAIVSARRQVPIAVRGGPYRGVTAMQIGVQLRAQGARRWNQIGAAWRDADDIGIASIRLRDHFFAPV